MKTGKPTILLTNPDNRADHVIRCVGDLKQGESLQVELKYDRHLARMMNTIRQAYPATIFTAEEFTSKGTRYGYIYVKSVKRRAI